MARSISCERSIVVTTSNAAGRLAFRLSSLVFTAAMAIAGNSFRRRMNHAYHFTLASARNAPRISGPAEWWLPDPAAPGTAAGRSPQRHIAESSRLSR